MVYSPLFVFCNFMLCHCIHVVYMHVNMHCVCINTPSSVTTVWFDETQLNMSFKSERLCVSTRPDMMLIKNFAITICNRPDRLYTLKSDIII